LPEAELTGISRGLARSLFGIVTLRIPFSYFAEIFSGSTVFGRAKVG
jgi:hypothetical protein